MNSRGPTNFELCFRAVRNRKLLVTVPALVLPVSSGFAPSKAQALYQQSARSTRSSSLQDAGDVERFARLPLLASIPKTVTPGYRKRVLWLAALKLTACAALSPVVTFALSQLFVASHIFDLIGDLFRRC